ncbi:CDGSH-type Zn-finger protein [Elusimicrobium posterum]|uniref:CDGSH iron-sulfur domain-containing protein n=1 Tax=Elusimicrobium posterum TaxID=3116653 RepID=UPI003C746BEE
MSEKKMKIRILPNGPYQVSGGVDLFNEIIVPGDEGISEFWKKGKKYEVKESYTLCRCGHSKNKPFCDGAHTHVEFNAAETADKTPYEDAAVVYKGKAVDMLDREDLCAVARFCDRGPKVWALVEEYDDKASVELAVDEACKCPAGRLTIVDREGNRIEPKLEKEIGVVQDPDKKCRGPLWVKGGIELEGADGEKYEVRNRMTLCRCGKSDNMPFCDASHLGCMHMRGSDE